MLKGEGGKKRKMKKQRKSLERAARRCEAGE